MKDIDPNTPEIVFMSSLRQMLKSVGIDKIHEAMDYFKLMEESVVRDVFNRQNPSNTNRYKEHRGRQNFIAIFKNRYKLLYDVEYEIPISDREAHHINLLLKKLEEKKIPIDCYLEWYFEEYVPKSKKTVDSIAFSCSPWVSQAFILQNKDRMEEITQKELRERERIEIFEKAKELMRNAKAIGNIEVADEVLGSVKQYNSGALDLEGLREAIKALTERNRLFKEKNLKENTNG